LKLFTKNVLETALNKEMTEHLGHEKNQAEFRCRIPWPARLRRASPPPAS